jgi:ligand-binding sensor domain-containing protein
VASGGGAVWLASEDCGAIRLRGDGFEIFDRAAGLPSSWAVDVAVAPDGTAWVATLRHGVVAISPDGRHRVVAGLPDSWILHVGAGEDGVLRVGTQGGAVDVDAAGLVRPIVGLSDSRVHALLETGGRLWAATELGLSIADLR